MATCPVPETYLNQQRARYRQARKQDRGKILDELVATTGYHRKHAIALLRGTRRHRGETKPGTLLKCQIQVRTFADWDDP